MALSLAAVAALFAVPAIPAQSEGLPIAERQLRVARDLERDGQVEPARRAYRELVASAPDSPQAASALLALARLSWPVEFVDQVGRTGLDAKAAEEARAALAQVAADKFVRAPEAPEALWRLALIHLDQSTPLYDVQRAHGHLAALPRLHPDSPRVPAALGLRARLLFEGEQYDRARSVAFQLLATWPGDAAAPGAWVVIGTADARDGRTADALFAFGRAQAIAQDRKDETFAKPALGLASLVDRIAFSAQRGARPLEPQAGSIVPFPGRVRDVAATDDGRLVVAGDDRVVVVPGNAAGDPLQDAEAVAVDRWGRTWAAGGATVTGPAGRFSLAEKAEVFAIAPAGPNTVWVADRRSRRVVLVGEGGAVSATARLPERPQTVALAPASGGGVWVLDGRALTLTDFGPDGLPRKSIALTGQIADPVDLGRDFLGNLYVLDAEGPRVVVVTPMGQIALRQPLLPEGDLGVARPSAMAVDRYGTVAIHDSRRKRILWFR